jgi:hypothetical protein
MTDDEVEDIDIVSDLEHSRELTDFLETVKGHFSPGDWFIRDHLALQVQIACNQLSRLWSDVPRMPFDTFRVHPVASVLPDLLRQMTCPAHLESFFAAFVRAHFCTLSLMYPCAVGISVLANLWRFAVDFCGGRHSSVFLKCSKLSSDSGSPRAAPTTV